MQWPADVCTPRYQASRLTSEPLKPPAARILSALPPVCSAEDELNGVAVFVSAAVVLLAPLVEDAAVPDEFEEELGVGATGVNESFLAPKPMSEAKTPPTETDTFLFVPATTILPLLLM